MKFRRLRVVVGLDMLDTERELYSANAAKWAKAHHGEFVLVKDQELVGFFGSLDDALAAGASRFGLESFLVRQIGVDPETVVVPALTLGLLSANR